MTKSDHKTSSIIFGFDSAWTNKPNAPGAICAVAFDKTGRSSWHKPRLTSFEGAQEFITSQLPNYDFSLLALDQPTIVTNKTGMRPVEKCVASLVSFVGGGVQPANASKKVMFDPIAPIWSFLSSLSLTEDPLKARTSKSGHFLIEVFPALALPSLSPKFSGRLCAPKYNPGKPRNFKMEDWVAVT